MKAAIFPGERDQLPDCEFPRCGCDGYCEAEEAKARMDEALADKPGFLSHDIKSMFGLLGSGK